MANLKKLFVEVPSNVVANFKQSHLGDGITSSDAYYDKIAFLGTGEIATRGKLYGVPSELVEKIGLTSDITTSNTLTAYAHSLGNQIDILNSNNETPGSVAKQVKDAVDGLVAGAPATYDTITEIAAWIQDIQGEQGTATAVATTLAKVDVIESKLGTYSVGTYTGAYLFAHNAALEASSAAINTLSHTDSASTGQYVSAVSLDASTGTWTITRENLPTLSIANGSSTYLTANNHEIGVSIVDLGSTSGITTTTSENTTTYTASTQTISTDGLITASGVYNRIHATEVYVASALNTLDARIAAVVAGATGELDSHVTITDSNNYASITIVQENGVLKSSDGTNTAALTINKSTILTDASETIDSPTTGTGGNSYIQVHVTQENYKVTSVTVDFDPWETYSNS